MNESVDVITPTETVTNPSVPGTNTTAGVTTGSPASSGGTPVGTVTSTTSKIVVDKILATSFQPGATLKYNITYTNSLAKTTTVKFIRQLLNNKGKAILSSTVSKKLKIGASYKASIKDLISKTTKPGEYTVKVKAYVGNKLIDQNGFSVTVEKLKVKYFEIGSVASTDSALIFDPASLAKIKSDVTLSTTLKIKFSYTNTTAVKQTIKMVRNLLDKNGKVLATKTGKWVMKPGEKDDLSFTQAIADNFGVGSYMIKIQALDWTTKAVKAENSLAFSVIEK